MVKSSNVVDFDDSLRIIGTAHVSSKSVALVKEQISESVSYTHLKLPTICSV